MAAEEAKIKARLEEVLQSIFCPIVGCWCLHGWEMLREGIEDYESLYLLRELLQKHRKDLPAAEVAHIEGLLQVPDEISESLTKFATEPSAIYTRRTAVARAIEGLLKKGK